MTDSDIGRRLELTDTEAWMRHLVAARRLRTQIGDLPESKPLFRQAVSARPRPATRDGWAAVGDAAASVDPLPACGILRALRGGLMAAYAAGEFLIQGRSAGLNRYSAIHDREYAAYLQSRQRFYALEQRWADRPFWNRCQQA